MHRCNVAIIGGGIVGLATGYQVQQRYPDRSIAIIEKESQVAAHQSSHNSGVLHSGIYYRPGTLRAINCREGKKAMEAFCEQEGIAYEICGKVIVAVEESELPRLENIFQRGQENQIVCEMINPERLAELEPHAQGVKAIHVPEAGICDFPAVCKRLAEKIVEAGGTILTNAQATGVTRVNQEIVVQTVRGDVVCDYLVTCAGLQADRVTRMTGEKPEAKVLPFRGEYFQLKPEVRHLCRNLIYPVPDPSFPFLGVHFTRMTDGRVECGPNAVLAFSREGYSKLSMNPFDLAEALTYGGFLRMAAKYWQTGLNEMWRSASKTAFVKVLKRLVPEIESCHLDPAPAGVRAQAVGRHGELLDEFVIQTAPRIINVLNAPSPAATASLNIGKLVLERLSEQID